MSGIDWASGDVVLACQLVSAGTLVAHLLILRPRGARQDLLLDARIIEDELDLAERLGHVAATNVETVAVHQVLRRIRQNPGSVGLALERLPAIAAAAALSTRASTRPTDVEYLGGALDRLSDAAQRYLRGAWPRAGALSAAIAPALPRNPHRKALNREDREELDIKNLGVDAPDVDNTDLDDIELADIDFDDLDVDDTDVEDSDMDGTVSHNPAMMLDLSDDEYAELFGDDLNYEATGDSTTRTIPAQRNGSRAGSDLAPASTPADPSAAPGGPAWLDLVQAETPRRASGLGSADRHARPYRPARSSGHSSARRVEQLDRSSVLPR